MIRDHYLDIGRITDNVDVLKIFKVIREHGGVARFVGGAVRNALAGEPVGNLDLSTDLSPDELAEACEDAGIRTMPVGLKTDTLGVAAGSMLLEISSLKKQQTDARGHKKIEFTDNWAEAGFCVFSVFIRFTARRPLTKNPLKPAGKTPTD